MSDTLKGLTEREVNDRIARGQVNRTRPSTLAEYGDIFRRNILTLFNALVVPAALALFVVRESRAGMAVSGMAIITSVLGLVQEIRAHHMLKKLALLQVTQVRVLRDGREQQIRPDDVVQDDLVLVRSGEPIVVDGPVLQEQVLEMDESQLTGEADPVPRRPGDTLLSGSFCVAGEGIYRAERIGHAAFAQQLALQAGSYHHVLSPFQRLLNQLLRLLTVVTIVLCLLYLGLYHVYDLSRADLILMIAATITSMIPQGLVLMTSVAFTLSAVRLSQRGAIVQQLSAVESMAAVSMLCLDKTGTLTTNRLRLDHVTPLLDSCTETEARAQLRFFAFHSPDQQNRTILALRAALGESAETVEWKVVSRVPFHSQRRFSAVVVEGGTAKDQRQVFILGAMEALQGNLAEADRPRVLDHWQEELATGARLLLFARAELPSNQDGSDLPSLLATLSLRPLALVALRDELRPDAADTLLSLTRQGIRLKVLSGDTPQTVYRVCRELPFPETTTASGQELAEAAQPEELIERTGFLGRLSPSQKVQILTTLQQRGEHVAMLGDGVNDVLAIKKANLGLAMGAGSEAAQVVASIVLKDNRFAVLPAALAEGRRVFASLVQVAKLFLLKNVYMLVLILGTVLLHLEFPVLPQQVTLLNALTIGIPTLVILATHPHTEGGPSRRHLSALILFVLTRGLLLGGAGLLLLWVSTDRQATGPHAQDITLHTLLLSTLIAHGLGVVLQLCPWRQTVPDIQRRLLLLWVLIAGLIYLVILSWPPSARFFQLRMPEVREWGLILATAAGSLTIATLLEWVMGNRIRLTQGGNRVR